MTGCRNAVMFLYLTTGSQRYRILEHFTQSRQCYTTVRIAFGLRPGVLAIRIQNNVYAEDCS